MDKQTFIILREDVLAALDNGHLSKALDALAGQLAYASDWEISSRLESIRSSYRMLLNYMVQGVDDPERNKLFMQFVRQSYEISDRSYLQFVRDKSENLYASTYRTLQKMPMRPAIQMLDASTGSYRTLFDVIWTSGIWEQSDFEKIESMLTNESTTISQKSLILSAVMMGLLEVFDALKFKLLLDFSERQDDRLRTRALVGIVLGFIFYSERMNAFPELVAQLKLLLDSPAIRMALLNLQMQLLMSDESNRITRSLQEDIIPEMMKGLSKIKGNPLDLERLNELGDIGFNPDWAASDKNAKLGKKIRDLIEMQSRGADIYLGSFSVLKHKYPFFSVAANWFCPFDEKHPDLQLFGSQPELSDFFRKNPGFCDSDKYSFSLLMREMPQQQLDLIKSQLSGAMGAGEQNESDHVTEHQSMTVAIRLYLQNLYRFFKLFQYRDERLDPFKKDLLLLNYPLFAELFAETDSLQQLADFAFDGKNFGVALWLYEQLAVKMPSAEIWQKIGYAYQLKKDYLQAAVAYEKANLLKSDSVWTLRQLASCYRLSGNYPNAVTYYEQLERLAPEDVSCLLRLGTCYVQQGRYEEAFQKLFKADYLEENSLPISRALAWTSLLSGRLEQAQKYYYRVLEVSDEADDYLNAGHAAWLSNEPHKALEHYKEVLAKKGTAIADDDFFLSDKTLLQQYGKSDLDISLMLDAINESISKQF